MDVMIVALDYPPPPGGIQTITRNLELGLEELGHDVDLLHLQPSTAEPTAADYIPRPRWIHSVDAALHRDFVYAHYVYRHTVDALRAREPDVVHVMHVRNWPAIRAAAEFGVPAVLSTYALELKDEDIAHEAVRSADAVHAISDFTRSLVHHVGRGGNLDVRLIPPSIDVESFQQGDRDSETGPVVALSRFVDRKNIGTVLEAWAELDEQVKDGRRLLLAGDGPNRAELERKASDHDDVEFTGWVTGQDKIDLLSRADLFTLVPSRDGYDVEGFGIVFIEAQASGTPVVGSVHGGVPEAIDDAGLLVEDERNPDAVAEAMRKLLVDPGLRDDCIQAAESRIGTFEIRRVAQAHADVYRDHLEAEEPSRRGPEDVQEASNSP